MTNQRDTKVDEKKSTDITELPGIAKGFITRDFYFAACALTLDTVGTTEDGDEVKAHLTALNHSHRRQGDLRFDFVFVCTNRRTGDHVDASQFLTPLSMKYASGDLLVNPQTFKSYMETVRNMLLVEKARLREAQKRFQANSKMKKRGER